MGDLKKKKILFYRVSFSSGRMCFFLLIPKHLTIWGFIPVEGFHSLKTEEEASWEFRDQTGERDFVRRRPLQKKCHQVFESSEGQCIKSRHLQFESIEPKLVKTENHRSPRLDPAPSSLAGRSPCSLHLSLLVLFFYCASLSTSEVLLVLF